ncbi:hypothetical protein KIPB_015552, partial [Kipferlia bialata]|eukprot:g15552.t1
MSIDRRSAVSPTLHQLSCLPPAGPFSAMRVPLPVSGPQAEERYIRHEMRATPLVLGALARTRPDSKVGAASLCGAVCDLPAHPALLHLGNHHDLNEFPAPVRSARLRHLVCSYIAGLEAEQ